MASHVAASAVGYRFTYRVQYENSKKHLILQINRYNIKYGNINDSRKHLATKALWGSIHTPHYHRSRIKTQNQFQMAVDQCSYRHWTTNFSRTNCIILKKFWYIRTTFEALVRLDQSSRAKLTWVDPESNLIRFIWSTASTEHKTSTIVYDCT